MTDYISDANVLMSILIQAKGSLKKLVKEFNFYTPDYALSVLLFYKEVIYKKSRLGQKELNQYTLDLLRHVTVLPRFLLM